VATAKTRGQNRSVAAASWSSTVTVIASGVTGRSSTKANVEVVLAELVVRTPLMTKKSKILKVHQLHPVRVLRERLQAVKIRTGRKRTVKKRARKRRKTRRKKRLSHQTSSMAVRTIGVNAISSPHVVVKSFHAGFVTMR
jgi:hypothetical protein